MVGGARGTLGGVLYNMADEVQKTEKDREAAKSNADLDKVTDYVEEREVDAEKFRDSMTGILDNSGGQSMESVRWMNGTSLFGETIPRNVHYERSCRQEAPPPLWSILCSLSSIATELSARFRMSFTTINPLQNKIHTTQAQREKELAAVKVQSDDVKLVMDELDIDKVKAERMLKEHNGNVVNALRALVQ